MLLSAVREGDCEPIKLQWIRVLSRFRSRPSGSVSVPLIPVLSCICSRRAAVGERGQKGEIFSPTSTHINRDAEIGTSKEKQQSVQMGAHLTGSTVLYRGLRAKPPMSVYHNVSLLLVKRV